MPYSGVPPTVQIKFSLNSAGQLHNQWTQDEENWVNMIQHYFFFFFGMAELAPFQAKC